VLERVREDNDMNASYQIELGLLSVVRSFAAATLRQHLQNKDT